MKKIILIMFIIIMFLVIFNDNNKTFLPKETIRYRIIANSDSELDQQKKFIINEKILPILIENNDNNINSYRNKIFKNMDKIKNILDNSNIDYNINYGNNFFPLKKYENIIFPEGYYESLVISLGDAKGENFWCILFPPLCNNFYSEKDIKYTSYIKKIINDYK